MTVSARKPFVYLSALLLLPLTAVISGCGVGSGYAPTAFQLGRISGVSHGGQNPIQGARVRLWVTNTTGATANATATSGGGTAGYGVHAIQLATDQTVKTDINGAFSFDPSGSTYAAYSCPAGQFAYLTIAGGNTGAGANANSLQLAVLGDCANLSSATAESETRVFASELSTAAAAYALANFIGETNSGTGDPLVNINAPATNNAVSGNPSYPSDGYCTTSSGTTTACYAAGLSHGFSMAAALVNSVLYNVTDGSVPNGQPNTTLPNNTTASVPQALLYTLGDIQAACTNTTGGTTAGTGSTYYGSSNNCTALFADTTPPTAVTSYPSDTLIAMVNLAKYPRGYANSSSGPTRIFALAGGTGAPWAGLSAAPTDFSLAIVYTGVSAPLNGATSNSAYTFTDPLFTALDVNDNVYIAEKGTSTGDLIAMSPLGVGKWIETSTTYTNPKFIAPDTLGNVWLANNVTSGTTGNRIIGYNATDGGTSAAQTITTDLYAWALAIDRTNNIWLGRASSSSPSLYEYLQASSYAAASFTTAPSVSTLTEGIGIDNDQNVWGCTAPSSGTSEVYVLPNANGTGNASYTSSTILTPQTFTSGYLACGSVSFDSSDNVWAIANTSSAGAYFIEAPTRSGSSVTATKAVTSTSTNTRYPGNVVVDGNNIGWTSDAYTNDIRGTNATGTSASTQTIMPCYAPAGGTVCLTTTTGTWYDPENVLIDSGGNMWVGYLETKQYAAGSTTTYTYGPGGMLEVLGTAAPTWGQLSWGHAGAKP